MSHWYTTSVFCHSCLFVRILCFDLSCYVSHGICLSVCLVHTLWRAARMTDGPMWHARIPFASRSDDRRTDVLILNTAPAEVITAMLAYYLYFCLFTFFLIRALFTHLYYQYTVYYYYLLLLLYYTTQFHCYI